MKTTGVNGIPKFGLLDFLGHPNQYPHKYKVIRINIIAEGAIGHIFEEKLFYENWESTAGPSFEEQFLPI